MTARRAPPRAPSGGGLLRAAVLGIVLIAGTAPTACRPDDQRTDTIDPASAGRADLPEAALTELDVGNDAYRATSYETALRHYLRVTELAPDNATGWFGVYMAHHALGNIEAADSALARARDAAPGASLIRPPADTAGGGGG